MSPALQKARGRTNEAGDRHPKNRRLALCGPLSITILLAFGAPLMAQQVQPTESSPKPAAEASATKQATQSGSKAVEEGLFPKSFKIPGTDLSLAIGGYVKVDFIQDFSGIGDAYEFKTNSIPVEGSAGADQGGRTTIHARETRFNLDLRSNGTGRHHFRSRVSTRARRIAEGKGGGRPASSAATLGWSSTDRLITCHPPDNSSAYTCELVSVGLWMQSQA